MRLPYFLLLIPALVVLESSLRRNHFNGKPSIVISICMIADDVNKTRVEGVFTYSGAIQVAENIEA